MEKPRFYLTKLDIDELCLMDDILFKLCFDDNIECTQLVLRIILDNPKLVVKSAKTQVLMSNEDRRSVRLDAFATDGEKFYDIEIQRRNSGAAPQRARFYSSLIDANIFERNKDFRTLPETYVIFITEHDVLRLGKQIYHVERTIKEAGTDFNDGAHIVYVNGEKREGSTPLDLLLQDFFIKNPARMNNAVLADRVSTVKGRREKTMAVPSFEDVYQEGRSDGLAEGMEKGMAQGMETGIAKGKAEGMAEGMAKGRAEGIETGRAEGMAKGRAEVLLASLRRLTGKLNMTVEEAMDFLEIPQEERTHYAALLRN